MKAKKVWMGQAQTQCDICSKPITKKFIDGKIKGMSCWGIMCKECFTLHGVGLGLGVGQIYTKTGSEFVKTGG